MQQHTTQPPYHPRIYHPRLYNPRIYHPSLYTTHAPTTLNPHLPNMQHNHPFTDRPPLWLYHDLPHHQWRRPEYHHLCLETVQRHCARQFRIVPLNRYNIYTYVPDLRQDLWHKCSPSQRVDVMRWELLSRYGGLFLDADVVVMRDLGPLMEKLGKHDCVLFGESPSETKVSAAKVPHIGGGRGIRTTSLPLLPGTDTTSDTFTRPLIWAIASRPGGALVTRALQRAHWLLANDPLRLAVQPHLLGRDTLWYTMNQLRDAVTRNFMWTYFHVSNTCAGNDRNNRPYTKTRLLMPGTYDRTCLQSGSTFVVPLDPLGGANGQTGCAFPVWFVEATREELLGDEANGGTVVGGLWRRSLGLEW